MKKFISLQNNLIYKVNNKIDKGAIKINNKLIYHKKCQLLTRTSKENMRLIKR